MKKKRIVKEYLEPILIAILIALFVRAFVVQAFKIPSSSMEPTLLVGDHLLVNKFIAEWPVVLFPSCRNPKTTLEGLGGAGSYPRFFYATAG